MEENQTQPSEQPLVENQAVVKNEQKPSGGLKSKWPFLVIAVLLVLLGALGSYVFLNQTLKNQTPTASPTPTPSQDQTGNPNLSPGEPKTNETTNWKTHTNKKIKDLLSAYKFSYPEDWIVKEDITPDTISKVTVSKNGYSVVIYQAAMGGSGCIYEGEMPEGPYGDLRGKPYVDVEAGLGSLRRTKADAKTGGAYSFCQKSKDDGSYGSITTVGDISYTTPTNPDKAILKEMDDIVKTIQTL